MAKKKADPTPLPAFTKGKELLFMEKMKRNWPERSFRLEKKSKI